MKIWLDVHLPPALIPWFKQRFGVAADAFRNVGWMRAADADTLAAMRIEGAIVMTKDEDFASLVGA